MPVPKEVKCPMCGSKMFEMGLKNTPDTTMSTMSYTEKDQRNKHYVRTKVFVCKSCNNIQSFLLRNPDEAVKK
jgi:hypothetical protein